MQQHDSDTFFVLAVMFKWDKLHWHPRPNIAVDIIAIEEVVFYFLVGNL